MALLVLSIVAAVPNVGRFLPGGLAAPGVALATGAPVALADVLTPVVATVVLIARLSVPRPGRSAARSSEPVDDAPADRAIEPDRPVRRPRGDAGRDLRRRP